MGPVLTPNRKPTSFKFHAFGADICGESNATTATHTIMFAPFKPHANAYSSIHVETGIQAADPHQLVAMLLDGALTAIANAVSAIERRDIPAKCKAVSKAAAIIEEGLLDALDMGAGGQVAQTLHDLYSCVLLRLTQANVKNDAAMLRECSQLLSPVRDAWNSIKPQPIAA
jgi:flagellar secretion chaperone FliS